MHYQHYQKFQSEQENKLTMNNEITNLKKQIRSLKILMGLICLSFGILFLTSFSRIQDKFNIIRVKGIVVEDSLGKDRILIGAPFPFSKDRVRTDTNLVRKYWTKNYEDQANQYMNWYKSYKHSGYGMVVLNEDGFDRVLIGDQLPDPNSGKRMYNISGMLWNDQEGWELGGAGVNTDKNGKARSIIGLDDKDGEAVHMVALEDGTKGLIIGGEHGRVLIGASNKNGAWFKNKDPFVGIKYFDKNAILKWEQKMN